MRLSSPVYGFLHFTVVHCASTRAAPTVLANDHHADSRSIPYQRVHTSSTPTVVLISNSTASIQKEVSERTDTSLLPFFPSLVKWDITHKKSAKEQKSFLSFVVSSGSIFVCVKV